MRSRPAREILATLLLALVAACTPQTINLPDDATRAPELDEALDLQTAFLAKSLCSGVWVNGRDPQEFLANDIVLGADALDRAQLAVNPNAHMVTASVDGHPVHRAIFMPGYGCTLLPAGDDRVSFDPVPLQPHPTARSLAVNPFAPSALRPARQQALDEAAELAFPPDAGVRTRALVVLHGGSLVAERYDTANGFGPDSVNISWSMGKSIAAALAGTLVQKGWLSVEEAAPIAAWQHDDDPRRDIRIIDLLHMSSGLAFDRIEPSEPDFFSHANHHFMVYFDVPDVAEYVTGFPLRSNPGSVGLYRNCDPLSLTAIVRQRVESHGEEFQTYPQTQLFDRIGATSFVLERDAHGTPIISGFDHATARDWARFGQLHLQDGDWNGDRILPEGWSQLVSAPAPGWPDGGYGGLFWRNDPGSPGGRFPSLPADTYYAAGAFGQFTIIVPQYDLVVVRMGYDTDAGAATQTLDRALEAILEQVRLGL